MRVDLYKILQGVKTYPSWYSNNSYDLITIPEGNKLFVTYNSKGKRGKRYFPRSLSITPDLLWTLGFIEGEGSNSTNKSAYRRFMITNSNPTKMKFVLDVLEKHQILARASLPRNSIRVRYGLQHDKGKLAKFWREKLKVSLDKIYLSTKADPLKTSEYGVCDIYISDVILRRVTDRIREYVFAQMQSNIKEER